MLVDPLEALGASGDPVEPTARSAEVAPGGGSTPAFMHEAMYAALVPKHRHAGVLGEVPQHAEVGRAGVAVVEHDRAPAVSSTPTRKFHIIQPVVVNQKTRSPSLRVEVQVHAS